ALAQYLESTGSTRDALEAANQAVERARSQGHRVDEAYGLVQRARIESKLCLADLALQDLSSAESIPIADHETSQDLEARVNLTRGLQELTSGRWADAQRHFLAARESSGASTAVGLEVPALIGSCDALTRLGRSAEASRLCRTASEHPRALASERA